MPNDLKFAFGFVVFLIAVLIFCASVIKIYQLIF